MAEIPVVLKGPRGSLTAEALVDSGATNTLIPEPLAKELGLQPFGTQTVQTAEGVTHFPVADVTVELPGGPSAVVPAYLTRPGSALALGESAFPRLGIHLSVPGMGPIALAARAFDREMVVQRLTECYLCRLRQDRPMVGPVCSACGCVLTIKTALPSSHCPIGRW